MAFRIVCPIVSRTIVYDLNGLGQNGSQSNSSEFALLMSNRLTTLSNREAPYSGFHGVDERCSNLP